MKFYALRASAFVILFSVSTIAAAMDVAGFTRLAQFTVKQLNTGLVGDIDDLIAKQEQMIQLGIDGATDYAQKNPEHAKLLRTVVANADAMKKMTLEEIEAQWHEGAYLKKRGMDPEKLDHFGAVSNLMDAVIHPATSYICLTLYKKSGDSELLARANAELVEVIEHVAQLNNDNKIRLSKE